MIAVLFLRNSKHDRYNKLLVEFRKTYANKECKYPQNITDMIDVMRQQPEKKKPRSPKGNNQRDKDKDQREKDGPKEEEPASSFAQTKGTTPAKKKIACFCCGDEDCLSNCFPEREPKPAHLWHNLEYAPKQCREKSSHTQVSKEHNVCFSAAQVHHAVMQEPQLEIIIDSASTISLVKDAKLLTSIRECDNPIVMRTNAGRKGIKKEGNMDDYGQAYYDKNAMCNIVSLSRAIENGH